MLDLIKELNFKDTKSAVKLISQIHFFFYKKQVYKKLEPQIGPKNKKILGNFKGLN